MRRATITIGLLVILSALGPLTEGLVPATLTSDVGRIFRAPHVLAAFPPAASDPPAGPGALAVAVDGAGFELRDSASGGPAAANFLHLESIGVCGANCFVPAGDDELWAFCPTAGDPNLPLRWSSGIVTLGVAGCPDFSQGSVFLDTNGYIAFQSPGASFLSSSGLPSGAAPNAVVAVDWQDLDPGAAAFPNGLYAGIGGAAPNRVFVLEWWNVPHFASTCLQQVEAEIFEADGHVEVYYGTNCASFGATGGEENSAGNAGLTYFNGAPPSNAGVRYRDVTAPMPSVTPACGVAGSNGWCRSATNTLTLGDNDDLAGSARGLGVRARSWTLDGAAQGSYARGQSVSATNTDGVHTATATATDFANNAASTSATLRIDTVAPTLALGSSCGSAGANGWCRSTLSATASASDATSGIGSVTCTRDAAAVACGAIPVTGDGTHSVCVAASDVAGNAASQQCLTSLRIDATPPVLSLSSACGSPGAAGWCRGTITATASASDATSGIGSVTCTRDGAAVGCGTIPVAGDGTHTVCASATDAAGNVAAEQCLANLRVDAAPPILSLNQACAAPGSAGWCRSPVDFAATASDGGSGVAALSCTLEGAAQPCAGFRVSLDGVRTARATATDVAGNSATAAATIAIDRTPPTVQAAPSCSVPGNAGWCRGEGRVTVQANDALSGLAPGSPSCSLDGASAPCSDLRSSASGAHSANAAAQDLAGNSASATATFRIDTIAPSGTVSAPGLAVGAFDVAWTAQDAHSGVARVEVQEQALAVPAGVFVTVCVATPLGAPAAASGVCHRDGAAGQSCYRLVVTDVAGNGWTSLGGQPGDVATLTGGAAAACTLHPLGGGPDLPSAGDQIPDVPPLPTLPAGVDGLMPQIPGVGPLPEVPVLPRGPDVPNLADQVPDPPPLPDVPPLLDRL